LSRSIGIDPEGPAQYRYIMTLGFDISLRAQRLQRIASKPSRYDWLVAVFVLLIQQSAFISMPMIMSDASAAFREAENPFNTIGVMASMVFVFIGCYSSLKRIGLLSLRNAPSIVYILVVLASALWSIHPDLSFRRGIGYLITMLIVAFMSVRFSVDDRMRALSWAFIISAIGSLLFVIVFPQYGIMRGNEYNNDLDGNWRGVYPHKNPLGFAMAVAVFVEAYLIVRRNGRLAFRYAFLALYFGLIVLSRSATALLMSAMYISVAGCYLIWLRNRLAAYAMCASVVFILLSVVIVLLVAPELLLGLLGKDATLTGRTGVWADVLDLIDQKPLLGWGYRAMWLPDDPTTITVDERNGNWGVPSAHNSFLEITLELGLLGLSVLLMIIANAFWRALRCCMEGLLPLGLFALMFFIGTLIAGQTIETMGQNQSIEWITFNILAIACGQSLASRWRRRSSY